MTGRAIGDVRPSQVITTFGPGAIVDLETLSVIVAGIDHWPIQDESAIHEPRLEHALKVKRFFAARAGEGGFFNRQGTVPAYLFPRYQVCPVCQTLSSVDGNDAEYDSKWREINCKAPGCKGRGKRRATTLPAPFIVACPTGHVDDFPWRHYVHECETPCDKRLKLYSAARTGTVADIWIECECGEKRSASDAFGENRNVVLGTCTRRRPWLGLDSQDAKPCATSSDVRSMQRGATNSWFSVVRSALSIKDAVTPIGVALNRCNPKQLEMVDSLEKLEALIGYRMFESLETFPAEDVWTALLKRRGDIKSDEIDLRWPEWLALRDPASSTSDKSEFFLEAGDVPSTFEKLISKVVLVRKLLEVRALIGFTRIDPAAVTVDEGVGNKIMPLYRSRPDWLPAVEVRGEGLFVELEAGAVSEWESRANVRRRSAAMKVKFEQWALERGGSSLPFPGARYILLHSLAHSLIRQLSLDCGYSASAVRERIYNSADPKREMAGILLYTASPDSEGSLGGLVDLGNSARFPNLLRGALRSASRCSSDPLCADHQPDVHATINAAACHACLLASETSCENFNVFLDRNVLVPTMANEDLAFFPAM